MNQVEMNRAPEKQRKDAQHEVERMFAYRGYGQVVVGIEPPGDRLESGPDGDTRYDAPENVVPDLVAPQELVVIAVAGGIEPALVEFVVLPLAAAHVKPPMQAAGYQRQ